MLVRKPTSYSKSLILWEFTTFTHTSKKYYLKDVLHNSIRGTEQVNPSDAANIRLHGTGRQVLLPQTWNHHHLEHRVHSCYRYTTVERIGVKKKNHKTRREWFKNIKLGLKSWEKKCNKWGTNKELLDCWTHTGVKHQHNLLINLNQRIIAYATLLIRLQSQREVFDQTAE